MSNELRPYVPTHPGNVLKDELQARPYAYLLKSSVIALSDKLRLIVYEKKNDFDLGILIYMYRDCYGTKRSR